jgi:hypothetical protein
MVADWLDFGASPFSLTSVAAHRPAEAPEFGEVSGVLDV